MPAPWQALVFSEQAEYLIDQFDSLSEDDIAKIYAEWEKKEYPDGLTGRTEALNDLMLMAQRRHLQNCGKLDGLDRLTNEFIAAQRAKL